MAEKRVIEYEAASELANDDWLLIDGVTEGTRKARPNVVTAELGAQVTNIATAVGGLTQVAMGHEQSFAPDYDESASYEVGDLVMQYHGLYRCTATTTGAWDAGKWARTEVSEQLAEAGKVDDIVSKGESLVVNKVADLSDMQDDIDSKQADTQLGGASILDENKVLNMDNFMSKESIPNTPTAIATFNASALPMPSLTVGIEAVQDLHGYDNPWPSGGGKNKLQVTATTQEAYGVTFTVNNDGTISTNGTATGTGTITIGSYTPTEASILNGCPSGGGGSSYLLRFVGDSTYSDTGSGVNIPVGNAGNVVIYVVNGTNMNGKVFKPMIRLASVQDATFAPYSNECPISGHTEVNVNDSSSNLIDITSYTPIYAPNGITYTINSDGSVVANGTATSRSQVYWSIPQDVAKTFANKKLSGLKTHEGCSLFLELNGSPYTNYGTDMGEGANIDSSIENANTTVNFVIRIASGTTVSNYVVIPRITDELHAYTTTLKDGQGNPMECYGGELSNENGVQTLTLTHGYIASYNGETLPSTWISDRDVYAEGTTPTTGAEVVYELANPQTIPQDNLAIASQDGTNNLWADSGDVLSGEYYSKFETSNVYSTEEKAVGSWIDGRTVYEKTWTFSTPINCTSNEWTDLVSGLTEAIIVRNFSLGDSTGNFGIFEVGYENNKIVGFNGRSVNKPVSWLIVQYTKS